MKNQVLENYKFGFQTEELVRAEIDLNAAVGILEIEEIEEILDEAKDNSGRFAFKLTEAIESKFTSFIRPSNGLEKDSQMNNEILKAVTELCENRRRQREEDSNFVYEEPSEYEPH